MQEKAYKLLAQQEKISNREAKELIDAGRVFSHGKKILIARALMRAGTKFSLTEAKKPQILFEDDRIIAVDKPHSFVSERLEREFRARLLNRLDKETSGVILLCRDENFRLSCIEEFKKQRVFKSYIAVLDGILAQELELDAPIKTTKSKGGAFSRVSKDGLSALSRFVPLMVRGKKTLAKIIIKTGRTHQIRVHAALAGHGVVGDACYAKIPSDRMYLHSYELGILDYFFRADVDEGFSKMGFELKNLDFKAL